MNFFFNVSSRPSYPLVFDCQNVINGSYIATGKYIDNMDESPLIYKDSNNSNVSFERLLTYDILETVGGGWLISEKLSNIFQSYFLNEVQLLKTIFTYKGHKCNKYSALNIYNKIDCYDMSECIYEQHPVDFSYEFTKIQLKKSPLEEYGIIYNIVRSIHDNKVVVSDDFARIIKKNKINSIRFSKTFDILY